MLGPSAPAIPWTVAEPGQEGVYIGQCSEIYDYGHAYMPIIIEVVTPAQFDAWVEAAHEQAISSNGLEIPRVTDVLGDQYWASQTRDGQSINSTVIQTNGQLDGKRNHGIRSGSRSR